MRKRFLIGISISAVLLVLLFRKVELGEVAEAFATAAPMGIAIAVLMHLVVLSMKAARWAVVLRALPHPEPPDPADRARRWLVFDALFFGYFGNYVLPAKLGELGRSILYSRRAKVPLSSVLATILFERFLDAATLVGLFYVAVWVLPLPEALPDWVTLSARIVGSLAIAGLAGLWLLSRWLPPSAETIQIGGPVGKVLRIVVGVATTFRSGLTVLREPVTALKATAWTLAIWVLEAVSVLICVEAFGVDLMASGAVIQTAVSSFAIAAPSAPGGLGIHPGGTVLTLAPFGVSESAATAASLVVTFSVVMWVVPLGLFGLLRQGTSTAQLRADLDAVTS